MGANLRVLKSPSPKLLLECPNLGVSEKRGIRSVAFNTTKIPHNLSACFHAIAVTFTTAQFIRVSRKRKAAEKHTGAPNFS
jgi:hypothetical protein